MKKERGADHALFLSPVFFPGGQTTAEVSLLFVDIQYQPYLVVQLGVDLGQPLLQILMYGGFGQPKMLGCAADGAAGFDHVQGKVAGSLLDGAVHNARLPGMLSKQPMRMVSGYAAD
jgi:hypothetical protein